jgi:DNA-binding phage protein
MSVPLNLDLPEPEWIGLMRAEQAAGKSISQIARETGIARPSVSMLLSNSYPAKSFDLVTLRKAIGAEVCGTHASAPMSVSNPEKLRHWRACRACQLNPTTMAVPK